MSQLRGPLVVSDNNPRYFTAAGDPETAIYLTGSHVNNNVHDGLGSGRDCPEDPERFDFDAYLQLLTERGHNFIRLWRWEQFRGYLAQADVHFCMTPQPWPRTGPGAAKDGKPKFDLSAFDQNYFDRLRERVVAAGRAGVYASVMFFEGFSLHLTATPDNSRATRSMPPTTSMTLASARSSIIRCSPSIPTSRHCSSATSAR